MLKLQQKTARLVSNAVLAALTLGKPVVLRDEFPPTPLFPLLGYDIYAGKPNPNS